MKRDFECKTGGKSRNKELGNRLFDAYSFSFGMINAGEC